LDDVILMIHFWPEDVPFYHDIVAAWPSVALRIAQDRAKPVRLVMVSHDLDDSINHLADSSSATDQLE